MGSTVKSPLRAFYGQDHPHIHGEHSHTTSTNQEGEGSPPYTWGAQQKGPPVKVTLRITPIYMGSTGVRCCLASNRWDHPHIHGEHHGGMLYSPLLQGSPPYTWGALLGLDKP